MALLTLCSLLPLLALPQDAAQPTGRWRATLASPGGELPFAIEIEGSGSKLNATLVNGSERIAVPRTTVEGRTVVFSIDHYASRIVAEVGDGGQTMRGLWIKRAAGGGRSTLPFQATAGAQPRFAADAGAPTLDVDGRWSVRFESSADPAVGVFEQAGDGTVQGTFLTTTGDYRYLAGRVSGDRLRLSCFDGAHAFLFDARVNEAGTLEGDFWSRDSWHETWTAERDPDAQLPDAWSRVDMRETPALALHQYPIAANAPRTAEGEARTYLSLGDPAFLDKVLVLEVFGSWCPNCHDLGQTLTTLSQEYSTEDVAFVGLAFELSGQREQDTAQVVRYAERYGLSFPILLCGTSDKARAAEALPGLTRVEAYPTTIFVGRDGRVRKVHSGFNGPGTGQAHEALVAEFRSTLDELVAERPSVDPKVIEALARGPWRDPIESSLTEFTPRGENHGAYEASAIFSFFAPPSDGPLHIGSWLAGPTTLQQWAERSDESADPDAGGGSRTIWHHDPRAGVYLDPSDFGRRLIPGARPIIPVIDMRGVDKLEDIRQWLESDDPLRRREAVYAMARIVLEARKPNPFLEEGEEPPPVPEFDPTPWIRDEDPWIRCTAAWAAGVCGVEEAHGSLVDALGHGHAALRREAARALGRLEAGRASRKELEALEGDIDPLVREAARAALEGFDAPPPSEDERGGPGMEWDGDDGPPGNEGGGR